MKRNIMAGAAAAVMCAALLTACGSKSYTDGTYTGQSSVFENEDGTDNGNGYGVVTLTISGGEIVACTFETYEPDGTLKDENYGKQNGEVANRDYYNKAQKAVAACDEYASRLVEDGSLKGIDAISGATVNYDEFCEAADAALTQAEG